MSTSREKTAVEIKNEWIARFDFTKACLDKGWIEDDGLAVYIYQSIICKSNFNGDIVFFTHSRSSPNDKIYIAMNAGDGSRTIPIDEFVCRIKDSDPQIVRLMLFNIEEFNVE